MVGGISIKDLFNRSYKLYINNTGYIEIYSPVLRKDGQVGRKNGNKAINTL